MEHSFDVDVAKEYGVTCAVILRHLYFWIEKNRANEKHCYDDHYWTYGSVKAFCELFPYFSKNTIIRSLQKLVDAGIIIEGNYNKSPYDRTKWYALTILGVSICEKTEIDLPKIRNGNVQNQKPIPDIYTDNITDIKDNISNEILFSQTELGSSADVVNRIVNEWNTLEAYGIKPVMSLRSGTNKYKMLKARIAEYGADVIIQAIDNVRHSDFLQGRTGKNPFSLDFEWFVRPNNFDKILNGKYNNPDHPAKTNTATGTESYSPYNDVDLSGYE